MTVEGLKAPALTNHERGLTSQSTVVRRAFCFKMLRFQQKAVLIAAHCGITAAAAA